MQPYMLPPGFVSEEEERRPESKTSLKDWYREFTQKPIPLPVWLWNSIVLLLYVVVTLLLFWAGVAFIAVILGFVFGI